MTTRGEEDCDSSHTWTRKYTHTHTLISNHTHLMCTIFCHLSNLLTAQHARLFVLHETLITQKFISMQNDCLLGCVFTAVRWAVCLCIQILTLHIFSDVLFAMNPDLISSWGSVTQGSRIQVVCSSGFISSRCLLLMKFENLKKKNLHFCSLIQQITQTEEKGVEWLTMAFNSKPFQRRKSLPVILQSVLLQYR